MRSERVVQVARALKVEVVTPAPKGSTSGNRHTAQRYVRILRDLGCAASVVERWIDTPCDLLVALHAKKSAGSIAKFARVHPLAPLVVVLTGTDLYEDLEPSAEVVRSLDLATRIIVLQPSALLRLRPEWAAKTHVILQAAERVNGTAEPLVGVFEVAVLGHLRGVKDPFLPAEAVRSLPIESKLRVSHVGAVIDRGMEDRARQESAENPRWRWLGERSHKAALHVLARAEAFLQTSLNEGGSIALAEAIVAGKPILATRIAGAVGMLGADHPGLFPAGDAAALGRLLARLEQDAEWRAELAACSTALAPRFSLAAETAAWSALLADLGLLGERPRVRLTQVGSAEQVHDFAAAVREGLCATPKRLPCRFFYDETGSKLFEEICSLPEYYLTRAEDEILTARSSEILALVPSGSEIVELGSGSAEKSRHLIAAAIARDSRARYTPIDISRSALESSARALTARFPSLHVHAIAAEYHAGLARSASPGRGPRLYVWLGSNVGNFDRTEAAAFLSGLCAHMGLEDRLVIGIDRRKSKAVLEPAYADAAGVTARFNLNLLARLAATFHCAIDLAQFEHVAFYDEIEGRIEMHLESRVEQVIDIPELELQVALMKGERIHTENSYKYSDDEMRELARAAGMRVQREFHDSGEQFTLAVFAPC
ncbi:MAG: L-histidine N(alpha)-methyltransferase [Planctomycetes bacterium]|nr:L-histidine N(alpha)-methyltransferase [Planctomycetota bacterium]